MSGISPVGDQGADDLGQMADDGVVSLAVEGPQFGAGEVACEPLSGK
jgi:hypothetical protein